MPKEISEIGEIQPGDIYEDSAYHPCLCMGTEGHEIWGVSLIDGSYPRSEDIAFSGVRKLTPGEAWIWRTQGPPDVHLEDRYQWWEKDTAVAPI